MLICNVHISRIKNKIICKSYFAKNQKWKEKNGIVIKLLQKKMSLFRAFFRKSECTIFASRLFVLVKTVNDFMQLSEIDASSFHQKVERIKPSI